MISALYHSKIKIKISHSFYDDCSLLLNQYTNWFLMIETLLTELISTY